MSVRVGHIEVFCKDVQKARDWYIDNLGATSTADQGEFQWISISGTELLLRPGSSADVDTYRDSAMALVLYVDDAEAYRAQLQNKGVEVTHGDNDECLTFQDPDGHWIQAVQT